MEDQYKITTFNIRGGLKNKDKQNEINELIEKENRNFLLAINDTNNFHENDLNEDLQQSLIMKTNLEKNEKQSGHGVAIFSNNKIQYRNTKIELRGYIISLEVKLINNWYKIFALYAAPSDKSKILNKLNKLINKHKNNSRKSKLPIIVMGDLNVVLRNIDSSKNKINNLDTVKNNIQTLNLVTDDKNFSNIDSSLIYNSDDDDIKLVKNIINENDLIDIHGEHHKKKLVTYEKNSYIKSRLDYILLSKLSCKYVNECSIDYNIQINKISDHNPVNIIFSSDQPECLGKPRFRCKIEYINDNEFQYLMEKNIKACENYQLNEEDNINIKIKKIKLTLRDTFKNYDNIKKKQNSNSKITKIEKNIKKLYNSSDEKENEELEKLKTELQQIHKNKSELEIEKLNIISKAKYKFSKPNYVTKSIATYYQSGKNRNIKNLNDVTKTNEMMEKVDEFYENLFSKNPNIQKSKFKNKYKKDFNRIKKLSKEQKEKISKNITEEEIFKNLNNMKGENAPGIDGIPAKVYQVFWELLKKYLIPYLQNIFENKDVSDEFGVGMIILIFKKGDRNDIANYRPITLLNTDYKLFMKILTDRIVPLLSDLISPGQSCNVPGRTITDNIKFVQTNVWAMSRNNLENLQLVNTDIKKAFDSVEWSFLFHVLENMNFPCNIINIIIIIYEKGFSMIIINGFLTKGFSKSRGVNQGDPLSPVLYVIATEVLRLRVKFITKLNSSVYADDSIYFSTSTYMSKQILKIIQEFGEEVSGNLINLTKSSIIHFFENKNMVGNNFPIININVKFETFKYLGVFIGNHDLATQQNEKNLIAKVKNTVKKMKAAKTISDFERIEATTLLTDATINFYLQNCYITDKCLDELQQEIDSVIGLSRIHNKSMMKEKKILGGFNFINLKNKKLSINLVQFSHLIENTERYSKYNSNINNENNNENILENNKKGKKMELKYKKSNLEFDWALIFLKSIQKYSLHEIVLIENHSGNYNDNTPLKKEWYKFFTSSKFSNNEQYRLVSPPVWLTETLNNFPKTEINDKISIETALLSFLETPKKDKVQLFNKYNFLQKTFGSEMSYERGKIGTSKVWPEAAQHFKLLTGKNITDINPKIIKTLIEKTKNPNFCSLDRKFDRNYLVDTVKEGYKKLQKNNNYIQMQWLLEQDDEVWKQIIQNRRDTFKYTNKDIREHSYKILMQRFEPKFYNCIFCKESNFLDWEDKFFHIMKCTKLIFDELNEILKITTYSTKDLNHVDFALFLLIGSNDNISSPDNSQNLKNITKLHFFIWKHRLNFLANSYENELNRELFLKNVKADFLDNPT